MRQLLSFCLFPVRGYTQASEATITGAVKDPSGAAVRDAALTVKNKGPAMLPRGVNCIRFATAVKGRPSKDSCASYRCASY